MNRFHRSLFRVVVFALVLTAGSASWAQEELAPESKLFIDFARDVQPILESRCLSCHGPEDAKNDFRIDEADSIFSYVEASDVESSTLWTDYLYTDDHDMLMPPVGPDGEPAGLRGSELAVIKMWIEEGAKFEWVQKDIEQEARQVVHESPTAPMAARIWAFQGLFHPASVHFPIALLMVSGLFVFLSFFGRSGFEPVAFHCLWIGALGAVGSCAMGWAYAVHEGYGDGFGFDITKSAIDRHRWLGVLVAVVSVLLIPIARGAYKTGKFSKKIIWFLGSVTIMLGVSIVGYQGGELTYGEDHYLKEFNRLFPEATAKMTSEDDETAPAVIEETTEAPPISEPSTLDADTADTGATEMDAAETGVVETDAVEVDTAETDTVETDTVESETEQTPVIEVTEDAEAVADTEAAATDSTPVEVSEKAPTQDVPPTEPSDAPSLPPTVVNPSQPNLGT